MNSVTKSFNSIKPALITYTLITEFVALYVIAGPSSPIIADMKLEEIFASLNIDSATILVVINTIIQELLLLFGAKLIAINRGIFISSQLFSATFITTHLPHLMPVLIITIIPVIAIEIIIAYSRPQKLLSLLGLLCFMFWIIYSLVNGLIQAIIVIQAAFFVLFIVIFYWKYYKRQQQQQQQTERLLEELRLAYTQVEESTIRTERHRVARDLHDTLTQGVAGTILQLEASEAFLESGKNSEALSIIKNAIESSRNTLKDSRITITNLRSASEKDLSSRLQLLADAFSKNYGLQTYINLNNVPSFADSSLTTIVMIVSESLMNTIKHAKTNQVTITGDCNHNQFILKVADFGIGTNNPHTVGHYGIQGMHERTAQLGGSLSINSSEGEGMIVTLKLPLPKGEKNEH